MVEAVKPGQPTTKEPAIRERKEWCFFTKEKGTNFQITLKERPDDIDGKPRQGVTLRPVNQIFRIRDKHLAELMMHPVNMGQNKLTLLPEPAEK